MSSRFIKNILKECICFVYTSDYYYYYLIYLFAILECPVLQILMGGFFVCFSCPKSPDSTHQLITKPKPRAEKENAKMCRVVEIYLGIIH